MRMITMISTASVEAPPSMESDVLCVADKPTFDEEFIAQFGQLSELWNAKHKDYTNKFKRQKGYDKLLCVFKRYKPYATVDDVRKKINSLRSNYRRELRKIAETQKNGDFYTPRSKSFKLLSFLYDTEMPDYIEPEQNHLATEMVIKYEEPEERDSRQNPTSPVKETTFTDYSPTSTQGSKSEESQAYLSPVPQGSLYQQHVYKETTAWSLANLWSQKLEQMEPLQRIFAEKAINDVLFEAQLGNLHRHSVKINECNEVLKDRQEGRCSVVQETEEILNNLV